MTLQKLGKHLVSYGRCFKRYKSFKSPSKDLLVTSVNMFDAFFNIPKFCQTFMMAF